MALLSLTDITAYGDDIYDPESLKELNDLLISAIDNKNLSVTINKVDYSPEQIDSITNAGYTVTDNELNPPFNQTYTISGWPDYNIV